MTRAIVSPETRDRPVLHGPLARLGREDRPGHGRLRARGPSRDRSAPGPQGRGRRDGRGATRGRPGARGGLARRELAPATGARRRDVHARHGAARAGARRRGRARRQGSGLGSGRRDVLPHGRRSRPYDRGRAGGGRDCAAAALVARGRAGMVTAERLAARRDEVARSADLAALLAHLTERAAPLLARMPHVPEQKALLSSDGGVCPDDGTPLAFDPWSPREHRCPRCGKTLTGERHDRHWARFQHLWLAERAAHLATLAALGESEAAAGRAVDILRAYARSYLRYPNRDNVLGPSRLFFSTYLESLWICNYLAAAVLLREAGRLDDATGQGVGQVADEAANLIGEYDEGFSNRQTWNNAALAAIAAWFADEGLAQRAIESPTGLLAHLLRGFGRDGTWYEGENYHLFALRGLLTGAAWAREAGVDIATEPRLARRVRAALLAPARTALPDFSFPARKDSRFGVSLAQPMYVELWEIGLAALGRGEEGEGRGELESWLAALYAAPAPKRELFESYVHDAPIEPLPSPLSRSRLSWWALLFMAPELPVDAPRWSPASVLLESQGLAVLRRGDRYVSVECGQWGGGHGHPDRLHLP